MTIHIRQMRHDDIAVGMRLKEQAGWNQTEADWRRVLDLDPEGCLIAEWDGSPVGTTVVTLFGPVAWIAMVLVDPAHRRRGIARALMHQALTFADQGGARTVRLQATPMGQPLYEELGFVPEHHLRRYVGTLPPGNPVPEVTPAQEDDLEGILALDRAATGTDRRKLLVRLMAEEPGRLRVVRERGEVAGFATFRGRARWRHLGPCIATAEAGRLLLEDACHRFGGESVILDVPVANTAAVALIERFGLVVQRPLLRMSRGARVEDDQGLMWACFGPEKG